MKHRTTFGVAALALLAAAPAYAACPGDIDKLRTELQGDQGFQQRYKQGQIDDQAYRRLFDAAHTFGQNGMEQQCQQVLAGIRALSNKAETEKRQQGAQQGQGQNQQRTDTQRNTGQPPAATGQNNSRTALLRNAKPLSEAMFSTGNLEDADVRNMQDEDLGDVADVLMEQGKITALIVGRGGFLGMGGTYHRLEPSKAKIGLPVDTGDGTRATNRDRVLIVVDMTEDQIKALPRVEEQNGRWVAAGSDRDTTRPPATNPAAPPSDDRRQQRQQ